MRRSRLSTARLFSRSVAVGLTATAAIAAGAMPASASSASGPTGYSQLSAEWDQWILQQPASTSPHEDTTGKFCGVGQHGSTWFLSGTPNSGGPTTRNCTVPASEPLFFPVVNAYSCWAHGTASSPSDPIDQDNVSFQRGVVAHVKGDARDMSVRLDGRDLPQKQILFTRSVVWSVDLPPGNLFGAPAQACGPGVDSGYYVRLPRLNPGMHTIHWHGVLNNGSSSQTEDVTYHLRVLREAS